GSRRQERGEMEDKTHLELGEDALEQRVIGDRSGESPVDHRGQTRIEVGNVDGDDRMTGGGEAVHEGVSDLAVGAGHERDGLAHAGLLYDRHVAGRGSVVAVEEPAEASEDRGLADARAA